MRRLNRSSVAEPACLAQYRCSPHKWKDLNAESRDELRKCLEAFQGPRCAYCEGPLDALGQHIEHFRRRKKFPQLTFAWDNLYLSCDQADSCGHHKDNRGGQYNADDLINPCVDDPNRFFRFRSDGTISVRPDLSFADRHRAEETLRVFNLNPQSGRLRNMRKAAVEPYLRLVGAAQGFSVEELQALLADELVLAETSPFSTAIRHVLTEL